MYNNTNSTTNITPAAGEVIINSLVNTTATIVYISHVTRDNIDVDVFWKFVNTLTELYLQDQNLSTNFIQYNITAPPTITVGGKIAIPIAVVNSAGTGATSFGSGHNILVSFFTNNLETDTRLSTLETKTTNISYGAGGTMIGDIILGSNNITGTTGLIQGFNIPALDTRITTAQTTATAVYIIQYPDDLYDVLNAVNNYKLIRVIETDETINSGELGVYPNIILPHIGVVLNFINQYNTGIKIEIIGKSTLQLNQYKQTNALMIGDSKNDELFAHNNNYQFIKVDTLKELIKIHV